MQILIILTLAIALIGADPAMPSGDWALEASAAVRAGLTAGSAMAVVLLCLGYNVLAAGRIDRAGALNRRRYRRGMMGLAWLMAAVFAAQVFYVRWQLVPLGAWGLGAVPVLAELLVWLPFAAMLLGYWASGYLVDARIRMLDLQRRLAVGLPVYGPGGGDRAVWGLAQFLGFQVRFHLLLVLLPLLAILLLREAIQWGHQWLDPLLAARGLDVAQRGLVLPGMVLVAVLGVLVMFPPVLAAVLSTRRLPGGTLRDALEGVLSRAGVRVRRILLWHTHGMVSNAAVMGLWGRLRYVLLSDGLLETLPDEQIEGVFGHELGHVVHHHILYYLLFIAPLLLWGGLLHAGLTRLPPLRAAVAGGGWTAMLVETAVGVALAGLAVLLFGWVSRRFERQADLTGAQVVALGDLADSPFLPAAATGRTGGPADATAASGPSPAGPASSGPRQERPALPGPHLEGPASSGPPVEEAASAPRPRQSPGLPPGGYDLNSPPHPGAAEVFIAALNRIADINGIDREQGSFRHGSIHGRGRNLRRLCDPARFRRFQLTIALIKLGILGLATGAVVIVLAPW